MSGIDLVCRRWRAMLVAVAFVAIAGFVGLMLLPPNHVARTLIYFEPADNPAQLQQEIALVRSEVVLRATARRLGFIGAGQPETVAEQLQLAELRNALIIERYGETYLIAVEARAGAVDAAVQLADGLAETFVAMAGSSHIVANAEAVGDPIRSPSALLVLAGIAVLAAFGAAGMAEWLRDSFSGEEDVAARLGLRQVTPVPVQKPRSLPDGETQLTPADCMLAAPLSPYAEAVRRLRIGIDRSLDRQGPASQGAVVMVTSPLTGDGKTTLSLALARAYAQAGRSTLLIDCDLATPNLHNLVGREPSLGLADYLYGLAGPAAIRDIISIDEASGVRLAMGAPGGNRPTEHLLAGPAFSRLIAAARQHFDVIVLDTPAIGEITDGLHVAALADIAVLTLRWGHTGRGPAAAAARALTDFLPAGAETVAALNQRSGWQRKAPQRGSGTRRIPLAAGRNEANVIAR